MISNMQEARKCYMQKDYETIYLLYGGFCFTPLETCAVSEIFNFLQQSFAISLIYFMELG